MSTKATIVVPTIAGRGPLLKLSIGSIQRQTLREIEIFIIGDGVDEATRQQISDLIARDARIRFFDHPKHRRRGEPYRHAALQEARGEIVCYMCDRDLMLPDHVETMHRLLQVADFASTQLYFVSPNASPLEGHILPCCNAADPVDRARLATSTGYSLSAFGHRLDFYHRLPYGWRETPQDLYTDHYMCQQFLAEHSCRAISGERITVLYFNRTSEEWPVARRLSELQVWSELLHDPLRTEALRHKAFFDLSRKAHKRYEPRLSIRMRGMPVGEYLRYQWAKRVVAAFKW